MLSRLLWLWLPIASKKVRLLQEKIQKKKKKKKDQFLNQIIFLLESLNLLENTYQL
jgi:hypothetical protein